MAIQTDVKFISTAGNIICYESRDRYYMRTKPQYVAQTNATKNCIALFRLAASLEKDFLIY